MAIVVGSLVGFALGCYIPYSNWKRGAGSSHLAGSKPGTGYMVGMGIILALVGAFIGGVIGG